jgi:hypothetical protein
MLELPEMRIKNIIGENDQAEHNAQFAKNHCNLSQGKDLLR